MGAEIMVFIMGESCSLSHPADFHRTKLKAEKIKKLTAQLPYGKVGRYENPSVRRSFTSVENRTQGPPRRGVVCKWDSPGGRP